MTNLFSGILAIIIALTSMCGGLAGSNLEKAVNIEGGITLDGELSTLIAGFTGMQDEEQLAQINATVDGIKDLLKAITVRFTADKTTGQMATLVNGEPAATFTVQANEAGDGWNVISSLFPTTMLSVPQATIDQASSSVSTSFSFDMDALKELDMQAVSQTVTAAVGELVATLQASVGEPETGSWEISGVEYTTKIPFNITSKEVGVLVLSTVKKIVSDESLAAFLAKNLPGFSTEGLDSTLENLQNKDESEITPLNAGTYSNEAGDTCLSIVFGTEEQTVAQLIAATTGSVVNVTLSAAGMLDAAIVIDNEARKYSVNMTATMNGQAISVNGAFTVLSENQFSVEASVLAGQTAIGLNLTVTKGEGRTDFEGNLSVSMIPIMLKGYVASSEEGGELELTLAIPLSQDGYPTVTIKGAMTYVDTPAFNAEGLNVVPFDALQQEETGSAFAAELQGSLMSLLENLKAQFPIIEALMQGAAQQTVVVEEAVPAE